MHAQKLELGKVSAEELSERAYPADTTAPAAIIFKKAKSRFRYRKDGFFIDHEYEFRIKIYKKKGSNGVLSQCHTIQATKKLMMIMFYFRMR
jgi:hypothetical protein